jgi:hypothetical protein
VSVSRVPSVPGENICALFEARRYNPGLLFWSQIRPHDIASADAHIYLVTDIFPCLGIQSRIWLSIGVFDALDRHLLFLVLIRIRFVDDFDKLERGEFAPELFDTFCDTCVDVLFLRCHIEKITGCARCKDASHTASRRAMPFL